jgi:hypothetical protein
MQVASVVHASLYYQMHSAWRSICKGWRLIWHGKTGFKLGEKYKRFAGLPLMEYARIALLFKVIHYYAS